MLSKKQSAMIIIKNKQTKPLIKKLTPAPLRLFHRKINSGSTPIFENR